jgi:16S rRNA (cytosine1407-C5)-methyltransferase
MPGQSTPHGDPLDPMGDLAAPLPERFVARLRAILPAARCAPCLRTFGAEPATALRVNTLVAPAAAVADELTATGLDLRPLPWRADAYLVPAAQRRSLTETAACAEGRVYLQNPSSMVPPQVLDPQPDEEVLDLAAAPGGKTLQLACQMGGRGRIAAVERSRSRYFRLRALLALHRAGCVRAYLKDGAQVWRSCPERFDRVLLDAPCSGEARFTTHDPATYAHWHERRLGPLQRLQSRLLDSAVHSLRPGGVLVYSTCSFAPEENEEVVDQALERADGALAVEAVELPFADVQAGLTEWRNRRLRPELAAAARILPDGVMMGFFVCRLRKLASTVGAARGRGAGRDGRS